VNERVDGEPRTGVGVGVAVGVAAGVAVVAGVAVAAGVAVGVPDGAGVEVGVVAGTPPVLLLVPPLQPHSNAARTAAVADIVDSLGDKCTPDPSS
jgi:hypothetical protein